MRDGWEFVSRLGAAAALTALLAAAPARAEGPRCLIELFTSQGCSSCPPADVLAAQLAKDPRNLVVSFPVDYWDYIGWKDTLASPAFTARQRAYAGARGDGHVYTPQAVVNGVAHAVGSDAGEISSAVNASAARANALTVAMKTKETAAGLHIEIPAASGGAGGVWLLRTLHQKQVAIGRGENAGRSVTYTNVVRGMDRIGEWKGASVSFDVPAAQLRQGDADSYVVLLQAGTQARPGAVLAAAKSD